MTRPPTAAHLRTALEAAGICPQQVVRNRATGTFVVEFNAPTLTDMNGVGLERGDVLARAIAKAISDAQVVDVYETIAEWRPSRPVLFVRVWVKLGGLPVALGGDAGGDIGTGWGELIEA